MNSYFANVIAQEYATKPDTFAFAHVTAPRPSCADKLVHRRQLTALIPGYAKTINGVYVRRSLQWREYTYHINGVELTLTETIEIVAGRADVPKPKALIYQFELPLDD